MEGVPPINLTGSDNERGVERKPVATVVLKPVSLGSFGRERQELDRAGQGLDGPAFVAFP